MQPAVQRLQAVLAEVQFQSPRVPVISNVDAKPHSDPQEIKDILAKQVTSPVQWETIITAMVKSPDFTKAYEFGPGEVLKQTSYSISHQPKFLFKERMACNKLLSIDQVPFAEAL